MTVQKPKAEPKARAKRKPRPIVKNPRQATTAIKKKACAAYAKLGNITSAMEVVKRDRSQWFLWMKQDPAFPAMAQQAQDIYTDSLEVIVDKRGKEKSDTLLIFRLKALRPAMYRETVQHEIKGYIDHHHTLQLKLANLVPPDVALALQNPNTFRALLAKVKEPAQEPQQVGEKSTVSE